MVATGLGGTGSATLSTASQGEFAGGEGEGDGGAGG